MRHTSVMNCKNKVFEAITEAYGNDEYATLAYLAGKTGYATVSIQNALRTLQAEGAVESYEHPSFPKRPVYCLRVERGEP